MNKSFGCILEELENMKWQNCQILIKINIKSENALQPQGHCPPTTNKTRQSEIIQLQMKLTVPMRI